MDLDGRNTYSRMVTVSAENRLNPFVLSPNPVDYRFYINGDNLTSLKEVQLFSSAGVLLKTWQGAQGEYAADMLAAGVYFIRLTKTDGTIQLETLVKK